MLLFVLEKFISLKQRKMCVHSYWYLTLFVIVMLICFDKNQVQANEEGVEKKEKKTYRGYIVFVHGILGFGPDELDGLGYVGAKDINVEPTNALRFGVLK